MYLDLAGAIEGQLRQAYAKKSDAGAETQSSLAAKLGVDRSVVHRRLTGRTNMTIETIADMVWALGHCIKIDIFDPAERVGNEHRIVPEHTNTIRTSFGSTGASIAAGPVTAAGSTQFTMRVG